MKYSLASKVLGLFGASIVSVLMMACGGAIDQTVVTGSVAKTTNPLVAQYTVVSGCVGEAIVEFGPDTSYGRSTSSAPVVGGHKPSTILVAGMRASTTYHMRAQVTCLNGGQSISTSDTTFTTGPLPSTPFPQMTVSRPSPSNSTPENAGVELVNIFAPGTAVVQTYVTDRDGNPIWYYDVGVPNYVFTIKPLPNGHIILTPQTPTDSILREIDLAGNTIREMDIPALVAKTSAGGFDFSATVYHHDICPLPNGHVVVLVETTKDFTDLPGYPGTTHVIGDALIDLDENWNPVWSWNSFDYLDVTRALNGLPDWTHSNAVVYEPNDGNLLLSMRHQSWVVKIDYANGTGTGKVLSKLGWQGDYALTQNGVPTTDTNLWFSFQHFPSIISQNGSQTTMTIWDNGDARVDSNGNICAGGCYSRATVYQVDDSAMVADLTWEDLPGYFSLWGGSISQLDNTNVEFDLNAPFPTTIAPWASEVQEVTQTSTPQIVWKMDISSPNAYRAYRIPSLYPGVTWQN